MTEGPVDIIAAAGEKLTLLKRELEERTAFACGRFEPVGRNWPEKYTWVPDYIEQANAELRRSVPSLLPDYNRCVLLHYLSSFSLDRCRYRLPPSVSALYPRELQRIYHQIGSLEDSFFDASDDRFVKDLAILTHRLIPVGAEFAEAGAGIPRRLLVAVGPKQFLKALWLVLGRCGGFTPFLALHTHTLALDDFNEEGWLKTYDRLAELLDLNPGMKGWLSSSWFLDPALETISPHLAYLRKVPIENGAELLFVCQSRDGTSEAFARSLSRRRLFDEGKYVPTIFMRVWPRKDVIAWSRRRHSLERSSNS